MDPKVEREMAKLSTYYNSGRLLSKMRSGKKFDDDEDSGSDSKETEELPDVVALVMDRLELAEDPVGWVGEREFALNVTDVQFIC
jgi:hypothetical protein